MTATPQDYRSIIDSFKSHLLTEKDIEKRLSDLMLVFDFSSSLTRTGDLKEIADLLLLTLMGYTASRRGVFLRVAKDGLEVIAAKGYKNRPQRKVITGFCAPYRSYHLVPGTTDEEWRRLGEG